MANAYITGNEIHFNSHGSVGPHSELPIFSHGHHIRFIDSQKIHGRWFESIKFGSHDDNDVNIVRNDQLYLTLTNGDIDFNNHCLLYTSDAADE